MGRLEGKVAFITGAARGQGRAHAVAMAREGADIIAVDICRQLPAVRYELATPDDLAETVREVEALGRRIVTVEADCRDAAAMRDIADDGAAKLGGIDIGVINHGILITGSWEDLTDEEFDLVIETNLSAVWRSARAVSPHLVARGGGSLITTSSIVAIRANAGLPAYIAAKAGVSGLTRALAVELAKHHIRVNAILPGTVATKMVINQGVMDLFTGGPGGTIESMVDPMRATNMLPVPWCEPEAIADAGVFLASDESRYITGTDFLVDAGSSVVPPGVPEDTAAELGSLRARLRELGAD